MEKPAQLVQFTLTKINVEKNSDFKGNIEIKSNIDISSIEKADFEIIKKDAIKISFNFNLDYNEFGRVNLSGFMILILDPKETKEVLANWKSKKPVEAKLNMTLLNIILQRCTLKALELEEELGLPFHIQMPRFKPPESKTE